MEGKKGVPIIWTVICPAKPNGQRTIITRSHKSLTYYEGSLRTRLAREDSIYAIEKDLSHALDYHRAEMEDWHWWQRLQQIRAAQRGENIIYVDFRAAVKTESEIA